MKSTSISVPRNSAIYEAGPRSCTCDLLGRSRSGRRHSAATGTLRYVAFAALAHSPSHRDRPCGRAARGRDRLRERAGRRPAASGWRSTSSPTRCTPGSTPRSATAPTSATAWTSRCACLRRRPRTRSSCSPPAGRTSPWWTSTTWPSPVSAAQDLVGVGALVQRPLAAVIARGDLKRPRRPGRRARRRDRPSLRRRGAARRSGARRSVARRCPAGHDRLLGRAEPDRRAGGRGGGVLERRGRDAAPPRRGHHRVPRGPLRSAALPRAGGGHHARRPSTGTPRARARHAGGAARRHSRGPARPAQGRGRGGARPRARTSRWCGRSSRRSPPPSGRR